MKRMDEVFNGEPCGFSVRMTDGQVRAGQHAINHIDALAAALESITADYTQYTQIYGVDLTDDHSAKLNEMMTVAKAALAAYRGDK